MKRIFLPLHIFILSALIQIAAAQTLTLEECYRLAESNFPLIRQKELLQRSSAYTISNISRGVYPQLSLYGQATYQSEVTSISIPGINFTPPGKDQYKVYAEVIQPLSDLLTVQTQKDLAIANNDIQQQQLEVELFRIKDRINQLFFGVLLTEQQLQLNKLLEDDLSAGEKRIQAAIQNGIDYKSSLDKIHAEQIRNRQRAIETGAQRKAYLDMLAYFIGQELPASTRLQTPITPYKTTANKRPELRLYEKKAGSLLLQEKIVRQKNIPRISLFIQGGAGQPSPLNMISNSFSPFAIGGIRASWNILNLYTRKNERSLLAIDRQYNDIQRDLFLFNSNITTRQQSSEIEKLEELLMTDAELVAIRNSVKTTSHVQLENGVISSTDYIREVNAEDQARQQQLLHEIQLLMARYNLQNTLGY